MKSFYHLYHEALVKRFIGSNDELFHFQTRIDQALAGIRGEERVQREFQESMHDKDYLMLTNLQFINEHGFPHQIDILLLTTQFIMLAEVKNISGTLSYDNKLRQFQRVRFDGVHESFPNPFDQLQRHHEFLYYLLRNGKFQIPIIPIIINANYNANFDQSLRDQPIINVSSLRTKLSELRKQYRVVTTTKNLLTIQNFLKNQTVFHEANRYVPYHSIQKGVLCPVCDYKSLMLYENKTWRCLQCNKTNRKALKMALKDYRILVSPEITNKAFREWTNINNVYTASKILHRLAFPSKGGNRNRVYFIPQEYMFLEI